MKKIVFAITNLQLGGAERVLVDIANELVKEYDVTIFTLYQGILDAQLDRSVKRISLLPKKYEDVTKEERKKISKMLLSASKRKALYQKYFQGKYDVEIAFLEGPVTWILSAKETSRKIAWVHNDISQVFGTGLKAKLKQRLNRKCYAKYDELIFVSNDNLEKFQAYFPTNQVKKRVIYNYIDGKLILEKAKKKMDQKISFAHPNFLSVCRLNEQKAIDRLIPVHERLIADGYFHHFYILGEGPLREQLEEMIRNHHCKDTFHLLGSSENPYPYMKACDYFALLSYYEGYPMVLLEAKVLNKYIAITDNASREVLKGYVSCTITPNSEEGIYEGLKKIITERPKVEQTKAFENREVLEEIKEVIEGSV